MISTVRYETSGLGSIMFQKKDSQDHLGSILWRLKGRNCIPEQFLMMTAPHMSYQHELWSVFEPRRLLSSDLYVSETFIFVITCQINIVLNWSEYQNSLWFPSTNGRKLIQNICEVLNVSVIEPVWFNLTFHNSKIA